MKKYSFLLGIFLLTSVNSYAAQTHQTQPLHNDNEEVAGGDSRTKRRYENEHNPNYSRRYGNDDSQYRSYYNSSNYYYYNNNNSDSSYYSYPDQYDPSYQNNSDYYYYNGQ